MVDGAGSVDPYNLLPDAEPSPECSALRPTDGLAAPEASHRRLPHPPAPIGLALGAGLAAAHAGTHALMHPREDLQRSRAVIDLLVRDELIAAPRSSLNLPIGTTRRIATVHVELEELQTVRRALGGKVNDVVLCASTAALRKLLLARGEHPPPRSLRAMVPVNVRVEGDHAELGNEVSSLFIELPVSETDPLRRYQRVSSEVAQRNAGGQALAASALTGLTELAPPLLHASLASQLSAKRLFNVTITNVPGSPRRLYAFGAPMVDVVPIVPLAAEHALGIAVISYAGGMTFGLYADRATVPDLDVLRNGIVTSLHELATLAGTTSTAR
jgi:diacylglycerol O-acyltransferase